ncbi:dihydropteroate synthase [Kordiimonas lacus]|uniref:Dihydropteroate synthase n=1 Tax=Kordiimonas lacus TaxID=637679 RepID=A0A1G7DG59_9PROT|nr:dihydropteroate synthase [Kordiimonas lacus]
MTVEALEKLTDGARAYLVPVGAVWGTLHGFSSGIPGLSFPSFRLIVREGAKIQLDHTVPADSLASALAPLPEAVRSLAEAQLERYAAPRPPMALPGRDAPLGFSRPLVMGVLNVTPDSFSDGGKFLDTDAAIRRARQMRAEGADIIDIGGESTRPGATPVWEGEEAERIVPVIEALAADGIPLSVDTRHSTVMTKAVDAGAHIINDVSALTYDGDSMSAAVATDAPIILMHSQGTPKTMQDAPDYDNVVLDVYDYLEDRIEACTAAGIDRSRLIVDPGIGFGKRVVQDNLALMNGLAFFHSLGCPVLLGASRKRFIGAITGVEEAAERMPGSLAAVLKGVEQGVQIVRVHDVVETVQAVRLSQAMHDAAMMGAGG